MSNQDCGLRIDGRLVSSYKELQKKIDALRILGKIIVFVSGTWDLLHIGHCRYFRKAIESVGELRDKVILVVAVDNDEEVKIRKGKYRPIVPQEERLEMLTYLDMVDFVVLKQETEQSWKLVELLRPDVLILSESTTFIGVDQEQMLEELKSWVGRIEMLKPQAETSTTGKIRTLLTGTLISIKEEFAAYAQRFNDFLDKMAGG